MADPLDKDLSKFAILKKPKSKIQIITNNANAIVKLTMLLSLTSIKN